MLRFALLGAGRIGRLHAQNLASHPSARLITVFDVNAAAATEVAGKLGARTSASAEEAIGAADVDAVLIASSTDTHSDLLTAAVLAGKAVLCEKPIDLDIARVDRCVKEIAGRKVPIQLGFNRRWDPSHRALALAVQAGEVGNLEQLIITSRDPGMPPVPYLKSSGGLFRDMMIHDFDLARFVLGEDPVEVLATGSGLVDPEITTIGDVDSAMVIMRTASGRLCHINNSRRASYGYDQRVEAFGSKGMILSNNLTATSVTRYDAKQTAAREPLLNFFIDRYTVAYRDQVHDFVAAVESGREPSPGFDDGRKALILADAALASLSGGRAVAVKY